MKPRLRTPEDVLTGTSSRMRTLPVVKISSLENHDGSPQAMQAQVASKSYTTASEIETYRENYNRKCVFTYEDKYTFARILMADSLIFDSHFESGNLHSAFRLIPAPDASKASLLLGRDMYDLYMHNDVHTTGHTQWFYFSVSNTRPGQVVTFTIRNFSKAGSMFSEGANS